MPTNNLDLLPQMSHYCHNCKLSFGEVTVALKEKSTF